MSWLSRVWGQLHTRHIEIVNRAPQAIEVVMDSEREEHQIPGAGAATFVSAKNGDSPTFHILVNDNEVYSKNIGLLAGAGALHYKWTGSELLETNN
jgi:hypothetical protein